jgi:CHU_C Type IX secretion signal domain
MKRLILILMLAAPFLGRGSHIVGGEFELIYLFGNTYRLNLVLYFDVHNGNPQAKDQFINTSIFRKWDNVVMMNVTLPLDNEAQVQYTQLECAKAELQTAKLIYTTTVELLPNTYNDPQGYYISWERCCRNYVIENIYSQPPGFNSIYAGQTFYLEIPPVVKNGQPFIDSSPRLFPPLSDYACVGKPYYVDFSGTDDDGDSLVYSLAVPLNTKSGDATPPGGWPRPRPYPEVNWRVDLGFDAQHFMQGSPELAISNEGLLTVTPTRSGLFVFAVKCEEFRDGIKIGETRRDFQMLSEVCEQSTPPVVRGKKIGDPQFTYKDNMNITFPHSIADEMRCIDVEVSDEDINNPNANFLEKIRIRAKAIGDRQNINEVKMPTIKSATLTQVNGRAVFRICFDECPSMPNTPYIIHIIAGDDACALPLLDTLRINVNVQTPPNTPVHFIDPDHDLFVSLNEGDPKASWPIKIIDNEGDSITVSHRLDGFELANVGMDFDYNQPVKALFKDTLTWDPTCDKFDFSLKRTFNITIVADDKDKCNYAPPDSVNINLTLIPPPNSDPEIDTDITVATDEEFVDHGATRLQNTIHFNVMGHDDDAGFPISFYAEGIGFDLITYGINFPFETGTSDIESHFSWPLNCSLFDLEEKDSFNVRFIVIDNSNKCKIYQADTVEVAMKILPPINTPPEITMQNLNPETNDGINTATSLLGNNIEFLITGTDVDEDPVVDNITLEMISATGNVEPTGYSFNPQLSISGKRKVESKFIWSPDCSIFKDNIFQNQYEFQFRVFDDHCESATADTITLTLNVKDVESTDENFKPFNVITTNGDKYNPYFALDGIDLREDETDPNTEVNLPLDNCVNKFEFINIYNRWGKLVFTSDDRYFRWYGVDEERKYAADADVASGVYYFFLKYTKKDYKGSVLVRF